MFDPTPIAPTSPNPRIDAAICDLIDQVTQFSDADFDSQWMHLSESEVVELTVLLIQHLGTHLNGKVLGGLLLQLRNDQGLSPAIATEEVPFPGCKEK